MPTMLIASSPVEIEAKAEEAGFSREAHDVALRMFHALTDRMAQATVALSALHEDWPSHRFYFGTEGAEMSALLQGLGNRADILDVTHAVPDTSGTPSGLYVRDAHPPLVGILVAHESHEGYRSSNT